MIAMRQRLLLVVGWVIVASVTSLVALGAVTVAGGRVNDRPLNPLSAAEVAALPVAATVQSVNEPQASGGDDSTDNTSTGAPDRADRTREGDAAADAGGDSSVDAARGSDPFSGSATDTVTTDTATSERTATRVIHLEGGSVSVRRLGAELFLQWATPQPGFSTEVILTQGDFIRVMFTSASHRSLALVTSNETEIESTITESEM
ncbi:hypothetical protein MNBD_ACTINO02-1843 [hydrothermal vent metagenome]|uniref:Uncharacterized protein n=1 Tax=hydrothermal vent metagenome TaxID=652676 RepID=A0A3B0SRI1_9ZZZZ